MKQLTHIQVLPILESLHYINQYGSSVVRFGDGEVDLMMGRSTPYQSYHEELAASLRAILQTPSDENLLVCLPDVFQGMERYNRNARLFWERHFETYQEFYETECRSPWYGSTFLSRPYTDLVDKSSSIEYFEQIQHLWKDKDILIVEGETSRSGVGNDLFSQARSVARIIGPSRDAFSYYDELLASIIEHAHNRLILLMLGPTAKVLGHALAQKGYRAIDLGHIDSEYEWYQMGAESKVKFSHKHTAEFNYDEGIDDVVDSDYLAQVLAWVGVEKKDRDMKEDNRLISVIVPVYNVKPYISRCLDSLLKQTYAQFELLVINDGSTDGSALILEDYAKKDDRIRVIHQENAGVSAARNRGIEAACGDYVTFVDSDDFVDPAYLEHLYQAALQSGSDIVATNFSPLMKKDRVLCFIITRKTISRSCIRFRNGWIWRGIRVTICT